MTFGDNQREDHFFDKRNRNVQGYFYINGQRLRRKLISFKDAGLNEYGNPVKKGAREQKRRDALYARLASEDQGQTVEGCGGTTYR